MKRILIDTNIYSDMMRGKDYTAHLFGHADQVIMCPIVVAELLAGFMGGRYEKQNRDQLAAFLNIPQVIKVDIDSETAEHFGRVFWELKSKGFPIPTHDIWIAACAIQHSVLLVSRDKHFNKIPGLYAKIYE